MKPRAHTFFARKESRKLDPANDQSTLIIIGDDQEEVLRVMLEHDPDKKYPVGGMCEKVKKGFTDNSGIPKFAIKKYNEVGFDLKEHRQIYRYAKRSEVISRHRGEKGIAVRLYHKQYLLNTWHDGDTLYAIHKQTPDLLMCCPIEKRLKFAVDILQEVATLHQLGLIHRDIKPANIMMNDDRAKLIDEDSVCLLHDDPARIGLICTKRYLDRELYERVILHLNAYKY